MKIYTLAIALSSCISINAQVAPILDYDWTIEKIVFQDEIITANPDNPLNQTSFVYIGGEDDVYFFDLNDCGLNIYFDEEDSSFEAFDGGCIISGDGGIILEYFVMTFISGTEADLTSGIPIWGPFTYDFREEGDLIYLDITNSLDEVATFWASTLSTTNFEASLLSIYPNPAKNKFHIASEQNIQNIEIFSLNGTLVFQSTYNSGEAIDVSGLSNGLYLAKLQTENGSLVKKLVKD